MQNLSSVMINAALLCLVALGAVVGFQIDLLGRLYHGMHDANDSMTNILLGAGLMSLIAFPLYTARRQIRIAACIKAEQLARAQTAHAARHEPLTGLLTRRALPAYVADLGRQVGLNGTLTLLVIDIDAFKAVNERHDQDTGDQVLHVLAQRIANIARPGATPFHLGADEFAILINDVAFEDRPAVIATQIIMALHHPVQIGPLSVTVKVSIGMASGGGGSSSTELMRQANIALRTAKTNGGGCIQEFDAALDQGLRRTASLQRDLLHALDARQFQTVFQPCFDLQSGCLMGAEARPRWRHPQLGFVAPATFMDLAEKGGISDRVFQIVLDLACQAAKDWPRSMTLRIGVLPAQMSDEELADRVIVTLQNYGLAASQLEIVVAEQDIADNMQSAKMVLEALSQTGVRVALGAGLSGMSVLTDVTCNSITIDQGLTSNINADHVRRTMATAVIGMAHDLDLTVTVVGVTDADDLEVLKNHLPLIVQGPLLGRPRPADALQALIRTQVSQQDTQPAQIMPLRSTATG